MRFVNFECAHCLDFVARRRALDLKEQMKEMRSVSIRAAIGIIVFQLCIFTPFVGLIAAGYGCIFATVLGVVEAIITGVRPVQAAAPVVLSIVTAIAVTSYLNLCTFRNPENHLRKEFWGEAHLGRELLVTWWNHACHLWKTGTIHRLPQQSTLPFMQVGH